MLVDGYNLLWVFPPLREQMVARNSVAARQGLVALLGGLVRAGTLKGLIQVVFDGTASASSGVLSIPGSVEVRFAPHPATADSMLVDLVAGAADPGECTVVTSDREVQNEVRRLGAAVMGARRFIESFVPERTVRKAGPGDEPLKGEEKPDAALGAFEVDHWLAEFGLADGPEE
jgi:predicted RNA-binding protein with PIN domain